MKTLTEIIKYEHNGIEVLVYVDHINAKITLMEHDPSRSNCDQTTFKTKDWKFALRGLEYMKGWQNILDAMKYAIGEATKLLEKDLAESSKFQDDMVRKANDSFKKFNQAINKPLKSHGKKYPR